MLIIYTKKHTVWHTLDNVSMNRDVLMLLCANVFTTGLGAESGVLDLPLVHPDPAAGARAFERHRTATHPLDRPCIALQDQPGLLPVGGDEVDAVDRDEDEDDGKESDRARVCLFNMSPTKQ